ncbi:exodeoxyribonuclease V subunit alpha [Francisellaceae bacterium]|nr:exodeoxyribonuclease V subunit alpha [Francisellaceae bacterium]
MNSQIEKRSFIQIDDALSDYFGQYSGLSGEQLTLLKGVILSLSEKMRSGHTCLPIDPKACALFLNANLASDGTNIKPFVIENNHLYFYRYWKYETIIAEKTFDLSCKLDTFESQEIVIDNLFPQDDLDTSIEGIDWQKNAVEKSIHKGFSIITGGPGTGKTTTVIKLLSALISLSDQKLNIALAAPTGKAAARLQESIIKGKSWLKVTLGATAENIPDQVHTIHKLLGSIYLSPYFKYNQSRQLPYDVVVIDEASMIDVPLMAKLLQALKDNTRLILLGDVHQLASVEVGSVLADLSNALPNQTFYLKKTYRFSGAIKLLADAVNIQDVPLAMKVLKSGDESVSLIPHSQSSLKYLLNQAIEYIQAIPEDGLNLEIVFKYFGRFQVLCSNHFGTFGLDGINNHIEKGLERRDLIKKSGSWYIGKPIMISENVGHSSMHLNNGDIGICLPDDEGKLYVYFESADGKFKRYLPSKLPKYQIAYAISIHKSQGSEFDDVIISLPETMNPVLTKELLYTGITRAKKSVTIVANEQVLALMMSQKVSRNGGLTSKIQNYS